MWGVMIRTPLQRRQACSCLRPLVLNFSIRSGFGARLPCSTCRQRKRTLGKQPVIKGRSWPCNPSAHEKNPVQKHTIPSKLMIQKALVFLCHFNAVFRVRRCHLCKFKSEIQEMQAIMQPAHRFSETRLLFSVAGNAPKKRRC